MNKYKINIKIQMVSIHINNDYTLYMFYQKIRNKNFVFIIKKLFKILFLGLEPINDFNEM